MSVQQIFHPTIWGIFQHGSIERQFQAVNKFVKLSYFFVFKMTKNRSRVNVTQNQTATAVGYV